MMMTDDNETDTPAHDLRSALDDVQRFHKSYICLGGDNDDGEEYVRWSDIVAALASDTIGNGGGEAVAWTGSGSMTAIKDGREGFIWPSKADAHPIPLYAHPPAAEPVGLREIARDLLRAMHDGQERVGYRLDLWNALADALATPAQTDDAAQAGGETIAINVRMGQSNMVVDRKAAREVAAMREAAAKAAKTVGDEKIPMPGNPRQVSGTYAEGVFDATHAIVTAIRALPLPSQEVEPAADCNPLAEPLRRALLAADNLLSELDAHQDITGQHMESDDQAIVDGAKEDMAYAKAALKRHRALCDLAENDADLIGNEATQAAYPTGAGEGKHPDTVRLDALRDECWDLRSFSVSTGGDDADVAWKVVGHWMAEPHERVIAEGWSDDPRVAIDAALTPADTRKGEG